VRGAEVLCEEEELLLHQLERGETEDADAKKCHGAGLGGRGGWSGGDEKV
jgi:hypothetical protein